MPPPTPKEQWIATFVNALLLDIRRDMGQEFARLVRMVVILDPSEYDDWLSCSAEQARRYFRQWHGHLNACGIGLAGPGRAWPWRCR